MKEYKIYPIFNGNFHMDWGNIMSPLCNGYRDIVPIYCFLIEGPDEFIMVDAGYNWDTVPCKFIFNPDKQGPNEDIPTQLAAHGCNIDDIKTVIITHLHHDHTGNMKLFKNAEFVVQEKELLGTTYPVGPQAIGMAKEDWEDLVPRFRLINGDFELRDGIKLYLTPGHTEGHQAIAVNTSKGRAVIMGDTCYMYGGISRRFPEKYDDLLTKTVSVATKGMDPESDMFKMIDQGWRSTLEYATTNGRHAAFFGPSIANPGENLASIEKLDMLADMVITHHDAAVGLMKCIPDDYHLVGDSKFKG